MPLSQPNFDLVLFGATGDLSMRKLLPCLYQAHAAGLLHPEGRILCSSSSLLSQTDFLSKVETLAKPHIKPSPEAEQWHHFLARLHYLSVNLTQTDDFTKLKDILDTNKNIIVYLSTAPKFFATACENLAKVNLNTQNVRIVLEKPLGTDLPSSQKINDAVAQFFQEQQIYRIDHYLGKESLQNLLPLRFGNAFFEPVWNKEHIKSVQITVAEQLGVEDRGNFYDHTGAFRDMVQNHIIQMLCFVAMEQPKSLNANDIRDEKLKVIQALKIMNQDEVRENVIRAQYHASAEHKAYLQENHIAPNSQTETYTAIQTEIQNERWQGVPFYLRTGKRLAERRADIVINFKDHHGLFGNTLNRLIINIQPDESIRLRVLVKQAGSGSTAVPTEMMLNLDQTNTGRRADAYELLLREVIAGRLALFNRRDELEAAWTWAMPILENWQNNASPLHHYTASSWGPDAAHELLARNGDKWLEEQF